MPRVSFQPIIGSPCPSASTAPATITIKPAAGPLMVREDPAKKATTKPPIIAVSTPMIGGKPEAPAMPKLNGNAIRETKKPDMASCCQLSFNPARPSLGVAIVDCLFVFSMT